jgi:choline-sulfatase
MPNATNEHPNVVFILSDDQGAWALGASGNNEIHTPHLDSLAADGTRLENFFCASPVCSPARASLLTGAIPSRHGVHDYLAGPETGAGSPDFLAEQTSFTSVLAAAGYRLGLSGKWHLGASDWPREGFTHWYALEGGGSPYHDAVMYRGSEAEHVTGSLPDVIADDGIAFLREATRHDEPFFLALNFTAPHKPFAGQHPAEFEALYTDCAFDSCPQEPAHAWQPTVGGVPIGGESDTHAALIGYFAAVTAMDTAIGRVLACLDQLEARENTLVIFMSDNGFSCGQHGFWGKGNGTFPQNMYDSSVKVPAIFTQPNRIGENRVVTELLSAYDVAATVLDLAGVDSSDFTSGPGTSFAGLLTEIAGDAPSHDRPIVVFDEYGPVRMIRTRDWKYVHRYPHGPHELYDLSADRDERMNLVDDPVYAQRVAAMRRDMHGWFTLYTVPDADGALLPVAGAGQNRPLGDDPLGAFTPPNWDGAATGTSS